MRESRRLRRGPGVRAGSPSRPKCSPRGFAAETLLYRDTARYTAQVARYFDVFGRERVHVIVFEDFRDRTPQVYLDVLRFLEVDDGFRPPFEVINSNKTVRSGRLRSLVAFTPPLLRGIVRALFPQPVRYKIGEAITRWNTVYVARAAMDPDLRRALVREFEPEVAALGELLGRDLSHWSRPE